VVNKPFSRKRLKPKRRLFAFGSLCLPKEERLDQRGRA